MALDNGRFPPIPTTCYDAATAAGDQVAIIEHELGEFVDAELDRNPLLERDERSDRPVEQGLGIDGDPGSAEIDPSEDADSQNSMAWLMVRMAGLTRTADLGQVAKVRTRGRCGLAD